MRDCDPSCCGAECPGPQQAKPFDLRALWNTLLDWLFPRYRFSVDFSSDEVHTFVRAQIKRDGTMKVLGVWQRDPKTDGFKLVQR